MAIQELPVNSKTTDYNFSTNLDGTIYLLEFRYNFKSQLWYMGINTVNNDPIRKSIPVLLGESLFLQYVDSRLPPGELFAVDMDNTFEEANEEDFGSRVKLFYQEAA